MKLKYIILLAGLAIAFVAASLWVTLSKGENAKAVRTKFRLGGLMLTVSSLLSLSSCEGNLGGEVMCYDVVTPQYVTILTADESGDVKVGDNIQFTIKDSPCEFHYFRILNNETKDVLMSGELGKGEGTYSITIGQTEYKGIIRIEIYGLLNGKEKVLSVFYLLLK